MRLGFKWRHRAHSNDIDVDHTRCECLLERERGDMTEGDTIVIGNLPIERKLRLGDIETATTRRDGVVYEIGTLTTDGAVDLEFIAPDNDRDAVICGIGLT